MVEKQDIIKYKVLQFYKIIKELYPVKKVILYGSYAKDNATEESDIDVGVIIDSYNHLDRITIMSDLFYHSSKIDLKIEPKCIFWDEYNNTESTSILSEIIRTSIEIV